MSKSNMLLGLARGKVGDLVFYRDGGEQRTRTRVVPKNPRTFAQMAQRVKIANVSGIFRAAADILRDSFVNRPSNQSGYNAFASRAIASAPYITKEMATAGAVIPQPAMASKGTLPSVIFELGGIQDYYGPAVALAMEATDATTIGQVSQELLDTYPWLNPAAELHFCTLAFEVNENAGLSADVYEIVELHSVLKLDATSTELFSVSGFTIEENKLRPSRSVVSDDEPIIMAVVLQSVVDSDGRLDTSTQYFELNGPASELYEGYRTEAALQQAVESYNAGSEISLR